MLTPRQQKTLNEIKDEIDRLHEIKNTKRREQAARELIAYIELHHNLPSTQNI
jgi:hypothetical protein